MDVKNQNLIHQSPDIQDNHVNGIKSKMDSLSIKPVVVHDNSCNGSKNGVSGCSGVCDTVVSSAKVSKCEVNAYLTPQRSAGTLSCSASSANAIARHAFFSDNKVPDHDSRTSAKHDTPSSVSSSQLPSDDAGGGNGIQGVSPVSLSNGNQSTGFSTSDSIFTYNLTDESQDELDSGVTKCTSDVSDSRATSTEAGQSNSVSFSDGKCVDKSELIRSVIEKVYVHTVTYTVEDLLHFQKSRCLAETKLSRSGRTPQDSDKVKTPSSGQKDFGHKRFTSRSLKDILKSMSPGSRRKKLLRSCGSLGSQSSNLGDSVDSASAKDEPIESFGMEEVPRKTRSTLHFEK